MNSSPDGGTLLDSVLAFLRRFVVFTNPEHQPAVLALWILHTYAFEAADATPYPLITSPEKRSGKSRLLEVLELLVARAWLVAGASEAVLFRKIERDTPTLLFDEIDAVFGTYSEKTEPLRAIINAGNRRSSVIARCVPPNHDVADFHVYSPKCLAGIETGRLPETIRDRSIPIRLHRKRRQERVERFRYRVAQREAEGLVEELASWAEASLSALQEQVPEIPEELNDRAADGFEPLLAIADLAGGDWPERARAAALSLMGDVDVEEDSWGVQLLADLRQIWDLEELGATLYSSDLCSKLKQLEDRPWAGWGRNRKTAGFNPRDLAQLLRRYGIKPKTVRIGTDTAKGYHYDQFEDAWARYVPSTDEDGEAGS